MLQWRPLNNNDLVRNPHYSPERDLAYVGPSLLGMAIRAIDDQLESPHFKKWCKHYKVTLEDIKQGAEILGKAAYQLDKPVTQVLTDLGFFKLKPPVRAFFFTKLGEVTLAALHHAVMDVSIAGSTPPQSLKEFNESIFKVFEQLSADMLKKEKEWDY